MASDVEPRAPVVTAITAGRALSTIGLVIYVFTLVVSIYTLVTEQGASFRYAKTRAPIWLLLIALTGLWVTLITTLMWWANWVNNPGGCQALVAPMLPLVYVTMKQFLYLLLYDRAKVVHTALRLNGRYMRALRWVVFLSATIGLPCLTWWMFFVYWRAKTIPEGACVQYTDNVGVVVAVAAFDLAISVTTLGLFIAPLSRHVRRIRDDEISPMFHRLVRWNMIISLALTLLTFSSLTFMTVELSLVFGEHPDPALEQQQIWATFFPLLDTILTNVLSHLLSDAWMPQAILERLNRKPERSRFASVRAQTTSEHPRTDDKMKQTVNT